MALTVAFDVYGTLIDPLGIARQLESVAGHRADAIAAAWRSKQLEYLFRRALGRNYRPFSVCTAEALDFSLQQAQIELTGEERTRVLEAYLGLPAYDGAADMLAACSDNGWRCFAFSNGEPADLATLLGRAGLEPLLEGVISVDPVASFKPDPEVYAHFLAETGSDASATWLVSGNSFDVIGAAHCGFRTAWLRRDPAVVFDPWGIEPTLVVDSLDALPDRIAAA